VANFAIHAVSSKMVLMTTIMNISLPEALRDFIDERIAEGSYANVSDYVRALIREDRAKHAKAQIETKLLEGLGSGPPIEANDAYWNALKADVRRSSTGKRKRRR
jgi:antitoxin ParD1/3/4